jgi:hypothetical protein
MRWTTSKQLNIQRFIYVLLSAVSLCIYISPSVVLAESTLSAQGHGNNQRTAQEDALSSLSRSIFVSIESDTKTYVNNKGENFFEESSHSKSDIPLMGVEFQCERNKSREFKCNASFDHVKVERLYHKKLISLRDDINQQFEVLTKLPINAHYEHLSRLLASYEQFEKYLSVLIYLSGDNSDQYQPTINKAELKSQLLGQEKRVNSLALASQLLARDMPQTGVYIFSPNLGGYSMPTEFSKSLLDHLKAELNGTDDKHKAEYFFKGHYQIYPNHILLSYTLSDKENNNISSKVLELDPISYKDYKIEPRNPTLNQQLYRNQIVSSDFNIEMTTDKGDRNLIFEGDEQMSLMVKLNQPGYVYTLGHIDNDNEKLSYLLEMYPKDGDTAKSWDKNRFIHYIGPDDVNKWVTLATIGFCHPFGEESLQVFASNRKPNNRTIPKAEWSESLGYYLVSMDSKKTVSKLRGAVNISNTKEKRAESVISYASFPVKETPSYCGS